MYMYVLLLPPSLSHSFHSLSHSLTPLTHSHMHTISLPFCPSPPLPFPFTGCPTFWSIFVNHYKLVSVIEVPTSGKLLSWVWSSCSTSPLNLLKVVFLYT